MRVDDILDTKFEKEKKQMADKTWKWNEARRARYSKDEKYKKLVDDHLAGKNDT